VTPERPGGRDAKRRSGLLLLTIGLLLALHNANRSGIAGLFRPLRGRFHGAYTAVGNLFSAYPLAYACSQIPAGFLADRLDPRRLILAGTAIMTLSSFAFALTDSYGLALLARLVSGVCGALIYTPAMTFGIASFPAAGRGAAIGVAYTGTGLGNAASIAVLPAVAERFGLTPALLSLAAFGLVMTALGPIGLAVRGPERPRERAGAASLFGQRPFQLLLAFSFLGFFTTYAIVTWLPAYLSDALGVPVSRAGVLAALMNVSMTVSSPLVGKLSDVVPSRRRILELGVVSSLVAFVVLAASRSVVIAVLASIVAGAASAMNTAPLMVFATERFGAGSGGLAVGSLLAFGQTGASLSGVVFGPLLDFTGSFRWIWMTCIPLAVTRYFLLTAIPDPRPATSSRSSRVG
jgi:MFS transporter, ACS family, D-galactonate transporter